MTEEELSYLLWTRERRENLEDMRWMEDNYAEYKRIVKDIMECDKCRPVWEEKRRKWDGRKNMKCECGLIKNPIFTRWLKNPRGLTWQQYLEKEIKNENNA